MKRDKHFEEALRMCHSPGWGEGEIIPIPARGIGKARRGGGRPVPQNQVQLTQNTLDIRVIPQINLLAHLN